MNLTNVTPAVYGLYAYTLRLKKISHEKIERAQTLQNRWAIYIKFRCKDHVLNCSSNIINVAWQV